MYINSTDPRINQWHKLTAMRIAHEVQHHKFIMFQNGPATMYLGKMHEEIEEIRRIALEDRSDTFTTKRDNLNRGLPSPSPYHDFNVRDLDKPRLIGFQVKQDLNLFRRQKFFPQE
jgi:hypothetical protein